MKKGFTVVELLVVIGIIGILMAVMLGSMTGASDSARATKCLAHLHTLAAACQSYGSTSHYYPSAGSWELKYRKTGEDPVFYDRPGWISWLSQGAYGSAGASQHTSSSGWFMSTYGGSTEERLHALTNGVIWKSISGNAANYLCPLHAKYAKKNRVEPVWSYVMNAYFGWDDTEGAGSKRTSDTVARWFTTLSKPDRRLLFAELPFNTDNTAQTCRFSTAAGIDLDPTLQYAKSGKSYNETIGFNHKDGKRWYAHVCFADGHTEKLELPKGADESAIRELTKWLCEGTDVSYDGKEYKELK